MKLPLRKLSENKFLVIQTASIGDVILATSVIEKLHTTYPGAQIDFLLKKGNDQLFEGHPFLDSLIIWDKKRGKYGQLTCLLRKIREKDYDVVVNIQRFASTGFITAFSGAKFKTGFRKNPFSLFFNRKVKHTIWKFGKHEIERNHELIRDITDDEIAPVRLYPNEKHYDKVASYKETPYICIAPVSLWFTKQFPPEKWITFVNKVPGNYRIYLLGSEQDKTLCEKIVDSSLNKNCINLASKLTLLETTALMKDAHMNFVNDSAPMHLASSVNAPVTAIFCSTVPSFGFGPLSEDSAIVETDEDLSCRPCGLHGFIKCPEEHFKCAETIEVQKLLSRL